MIVCIVIIALLALALGVTVLVFLHREDALKAEIRDEKEKSETNYNNVKFLLNVSHELKTPLTLIKSPLARMLKGLSKEDPDYKTLTGIYRQAARMNTLLLTVLDAHKIQEGSTTLMAEKTEVIPWVEKIVADFDEEAQGRGIILQRQYDSDGVEAQIDSAKLENVMTNLLINAIKHSPGNSRITVGTSILTGGDKVRVFVSDQGDGLGGVDMTKLFTRFYQGFAQKTGSGLGLAYASTIVELHGGSMGAKDNHDVGATFYFDIPVIPSSIREEQTVEDQPSRRTSFDVHDLKDAVVLIVDDDTALREYLSEEFSSCAAKALTAANGKKALEVIASERVDVVVSDVMMPEMDGFELCSQIRASDKWHDLPIVLLTARAEAKSREKGLSLGADAYVPKPFDMDALSSMIDKILKV